MRRSAGQARLLGLAGDDRDATVADVARTVLRHALPVLGAVRGGVGVPDGDEPRIRFLA